MPAAQNDHSVQGLISRVVGEYMGPKRDLPAVLVLDFWNNIRREEEGGDSKKLGSICVTGHQTFTG